MAREKGPEALAEEIVGNWGAGEDEVKLKKLFTIATRALMRLSECDGGCEGPLGCMCKADTAKAALRSLLRESY